MDRTEIIERINILQKYTLDILEGCFQLQKASSTERIARSPSLLLIQAAIEPSQPQRTQGFWKTFFESRTEESVKRAIAVDVYQKYQALLKTIQQEIPEVYQQHQGIVLTQNTTPEAWFHIILHDINYIKSLVVHIIEQKACVDIGKEGIFFAGQAFDSWLLIASILESAQSELVIIDSYIDVKVINLLGGRTLPPIIKGLTSPNSINSQKKKDNIVETARLFNNEHHSLTLKVSDEFHDRFIFVDDSVFYHLGASINQAGIKKGFMFSCIEEPSIIEMLHDKFTEIWNNTTTALVEP